MKKVNWTKKILTSVLVAVIVLTSAFVTVPVQAANTPIVGKKYMLATKEKMTLNVYYVPNKAKVTFKSKKPAVATVNKKGLITAKKPGKTDIVVTIKAGKKTYEAKTKIVVKKKLNASEYLQTCFTEYALMYYSAYNLMKDNGWSKNEEVTDCIGEAADILNAADEMLKNPKSYTDDEFMEMMEKMEASSNDMVELLPIILEKAS